MVASKNSKYDKINHKFPIKIKYSLSLMISYSQLGLRYHSKEPLLHPIIFNFIHILNHFMKILKYRILLFVPIIIINSTKKEISYE